MPKKYSKNTPQGVDLTQIIWSYKCEANILTAMGENERSIRVYEHILSICENMSLQERKGTLVELENNYLYKLGYIHITLAMLYIKTGHAEVAQNHYHLWKKYHQAIPKVVSVELYGTVMAYLKQVGKYKEALDYSKETRNMIVIY